MDRLMVKDVLASEKTSASGLLNDFTIEDLQKIARVVQDEIKSRKRGFEKDDVRDVLYQLYVGFAGEAQEGQIDILRKLAKMIEDEDYMNNMSHSGKRWDMKIEDFLGHPTKPVASDDDTTRLRRVVEAIQTVRSQSDTASIRHGLLVAFLHAAVETIRDANRNRPDSKSFSRQALAQTISSGKPQDMVDLPKALRAGGRIARLFGRNVGYVFSLKAGTDYMIERGMNEHAVNAFARFTEEYESLTSPLELTRLACAVLSKLARYFGWESWVFRSTTWRFDLVPDGLIKDKDWTANNAICFKQQLARPVLTPMIAPGPEEHTMEADSISTMRLCNSIYLNPQPVLRLAQDGLIKIKSSSLSGSPGNLYDFYVHSICAGRTLLKDNAYLQEVLSIANYDTATKFAMIALTSSYYKEYLSDGSAQKERIQKVEAEAIAQTLVALEGNATDGSGDAAKMLLIHHAILNPNVHSAHWTNYLYQLQDSPGQQSNLIMATHSIWLMTILPLNEKYHFQTFNYHWVGCGEENSLTKVNGILGTSRKMLYFEYLITIAAKFPNTVDHRNLLCDIGQSCQWVDVTEAETATRIALKTAETYKLATTLYALARLCRFTPGHSRVREICNRLTRELYELPVSGEEYSGLHPAWCFPIACACTEDAEEYAKMDQVLEYIGNVNKSNVSDLCRLVRWIWKWKDGRHLGKEWWEDMTKYLDSVMNGNLICVS